VKSGLPLSSGIGLSQALAPPNGTRSVRARSHGVATKFILGTTLKANKVSHAVYRDFLPDALAEGRYTAAPAPTVTGHGMNVIQDAMDLHLRGVSRTKIVVTLRLT